MADKKPLENLNKPAQVTEEAQAEVSQSRQQSGGNALLDAEIAADKTVNNEPIDHPIATNFSDRAESEAGKNYSTTGAYPVDAEAFENNNRLENNNR